MLNGLGRSVGLVGCSVHVHDGVGISRVLGRWVDSLGKSDGVVGFHVDLGESLVDTGRVEESTDGKVASDGLVPDTRVLLFDQTGSSVNAVLA